MSIMKNASNSQQKPILIGKPLTSEQQVEYTQAFTLFDRDKDGYINCKEISILIRSLERNPTDNEIQRLIDNIVHEGSNLIDCKQFLTMMSILEKTRATDARKELREIFSAIDTDSNGLIDGEELKVAMRLLTNGIEDMKLSKEEIDEMIAEVDGNKDGRLTFDEFAGLFVALK